MMPMMGWGWVGMLIGGLIVLGLLVGLVWVLYRLVKGRGRLDRQPRAEKVLHERYAKGEIDRETYQRMLNDIS